MGLMVLVLQAELSLVLLGPQHPNEQVRASLIRSLGEITRSEDLLVALVARASVDKAPTVRAAAAAALLGRKVVPLPCRRILLDLLEDQNPYVRATAADCINRYSDAHLARTIPILVDALDQKMDPDARRAALSGIRHLGPKASAAIPALLKALRESQGVSRGIICLAIGDVGRNSRECVNVLLSLLDDQQDRDLVVACFAGIALAHIGEPSVPGLVRQLQNPKCRARHLAAQALAAIGPAAKRAVPALKEALTDADPNVRRSAAVALKAIESR